MIGQAEESHWPPPPIPFPLSLPSVCDERNHFCRHLQSVPNNSLCFTEWKGGVIWKMSCSEVHEGVKLQTPLCPRPCASKGISSFIDRAAELQPDGGCCCWWWGPTAPDILLQPWLLLFPGHLLSIAVTFPISQGLLYEDRRHCHHELSGKCT